MPDFDVVIVGGGVAGLTALAELDRAGLRVLCIEARDRIGGRIFSAHDALAPIPVELGAEFIHGRPPEIWNIVRSGSLAVYDCADAAVHIRDGKVQRHGDAWEPIGQLMADMRKAADQSGDQPFSAFLQRSSHSAVAKELSASFVEGFNAARKEVIGIASLAKDGRAADQIEGDRSFRLPGGYDALPLTILRGVPEGQSKLRLNTVLIGVEWQAGSVTLRTASALTGATHTISARRVLLTLPLGVLQARKPTPGSIGWKPVPGRVLEAASELAFGQVVRVVLRFRNAFWEDNTDFADAGFFLSNETLFPTWWTPLATRASMLTGWSAGPHADDLLAKPRKIVIAEAVASLARVLGVPAATISRLLEQAYFHDWHSDPFARGAYSYVPAGALSASEALAEPVEDTLYFAGEATELNGHSATVHGAMASALRAARRITQAGG